MKHCEEYLESVFPNLKIDFDDLSFFDITNQVPVKRGLGELYSTRRRWFKELSPQVQHTVKHCVNGIVNTVKNPSKKEACDDTSPRHVETSDWNHVRHYHSDYGERIWGIWQGKDEDERFIATIKAFALESREKFPRLRTQIDEWFIKKAGILQVRLGDRRRRDEVVKSYKILTYKPVCPGDFVVTKYKT